jgi:hypothetical protein
MFRYPIIKGNHLFTPSAILFVFLITYLNSRLEFVGVSYFYSFILSIAVLVLMFKVFTITFGSIESAIAKRKWFVVGFDILLAGIQFTLAIFAVNHLTVDTFPQRTIELILYSNIAFFMQSFLADFKPAITTTLVVLAVYVISFLALLFKWFDTDTELFVLMQQVISYLALFSEIALLFLTVKKYVSYVPSKSKT